MNREEIIIKDSLDIVKKGIYALNRRDVRYLTELSNRTVHNSSIFQDKYSISIAIIVYSLAKIFEKRKYHYYKNWNTFYKNILNFFGKAKNYLIKKDLNSYEKILRSIFMEIKGLDKKTNLYVEAVMQSTRVKKGSGVYAHGISMGRVSELLGITQWELMPYIGSTRINDEFFGMDVKKRVEMARGIFGVK